MWSHLNVNGVFTELARLTHVLHWRIFLIVFFIMYSDYSRVEGNLDVHYSSYVSSGQSILFVVFSLFFLDMRDIILNSRVIRINSALVMWIAENLFPYPMELWEFILNLKVTFYNLYLTNV